MPGVADYSINVPAFGASLSEISTALWERLGKGHEVSAHLIRDGQDIFIRMFLDRAVVYQSNAVRETEADTLLRSAAVMLLRDRYDNEIRHHCFASHNLLPESLRDQCSSWYIGLGYLWLDNNRLWKAEDQFNSALKFNPGGSTAHVGLSEVYRRLDLKNESAEHAELAWKAAEHAKSTNNQKSGDALTELGLTAIDEGDWPEAKQIYDNWRNACKPKCSNVDLFIGLGRIEFHEQHLDAAGRYFESALQLSPTFAYARDSLGDVHAAEGRWQDAMDDYREAAWLDPASSLPYSAMGELLLRQDDPQDAIRELAKAVLINPQNIDVLKRTEEALLTAPGTTTPTARVTLMKAFCQLVATVPSKDISAVCSR